MKKKKHAYKAENLGSQPFEKEFTMFLYLKALHIVFIVTWFAGMFYIVRLFIYGVEANDREEPARSILEQQLSLMTRRLWYGITWPSAILTLILGPVVMFHPERDWYRALDTDAGRWLLVKLVFVLLLYGYHLSLHHIYRKQMNGQFPYSSQKLRIWNEVATIFLVIIVMLATVKQAISWVWGLLGLIAFVVILMSAIRIYKVSRAKDSRTKGVPRT